MEISKRRISKNISTLDKAYELSALINADSFFYTLSTEEELVLSNELSFSDASSSETLDGIDHSRISKARFAIHNAHFTIVPADDFDIDNQGDFLSAAIGNNGYSDGVHRVDFVEKANAYVCYGVNRLELVRCASIVPEASIMHSTTVIMSSVLSSDQAATIHLSKLGHQVIMACAADGQLKIVNTLNDVTPISLLYYATLLKKTFKLGQDDLVIELSGDFTNEDGCISLLSRYFKTVNYKESTLRFDDEILTSSMYFPLTSISQCA